MKLHDVSKSFDNELFADVNDLTSTFYGQVRPYAEGARSGAATQRRILSVAPDVTIPTGQVIQHIDSSLTYILGAQSVDFWKGSAIRHKYPMIPTSKQMSFGDIAAILSGSGLTENEYFFPNYVRRVVDDTETSDFLQGHELYFRSSISLSVGDIINYNDTDYYRARMDVFEDGAGFGVCEAVKVENPIDSVTHIYSDPSSYDAATDSRTPIPIPNVSVFIEDLKFNFEFISPAFEEILPGDKAISFAQSPIYPARVGDYIGDYLILAVRDMGTFYTVHGRLP